MFTCPECHSRFETFDSLQAHRLDPYGRKARGEEAKDGRFPAHDASFRKASPRAIQEFISSTGRKPLVFQFLYAGEIVADGLTELQCDYLDDRILNTHPKAKLETVRAWAEQLKKADPPKG